MGDRLGTAEMELVIQPSCDDELLVIIILVVVKITEVIRESSIHIMQFDIVIHRPTLCNGVIFSHVIVKCSALECLGLVMF